MKLVKLNGYVTDIYTVMKRGIIFGFEDEELGEVCCRIDTGMGDLGSLCNLIRKGCHFSLVTKVIGMKRVRKDGAVFVNNHLDIIGYTLIENDNKLEVEGGEPDEKRI